MISKSDQELIDKTDSTIAELVYRKTEIQKAFNIYNGFRDKEQFKYLEDNFGIGSPTSVEFTPLVRKHIDALVGEFLSNPILPKISCKDKETISKIARDKQLKINEEIAKFLRDKLQNQILRFIDGKKMEDVSIKEALDSLIDNLQLDFVSDYEIAAQNVIEYCMQSRRTDLINKLSQLCRDLFICGYTYFKTKPSASGQNVEIEVLDPRNVFIDRNVESPYVRDSYRAVVRHWMTAPQILKRYGKELDKEDVKKLKEEWTDISDATSRYVRSYVEHGVPNSDGILAGDEIIPGYPDVQYSSQRFRYIPVYEVEWIDTDDDFIMHRYQSIRIGDSMSNDSFYILKGEDENAVRTVDDPAHVSLSVNGVYFLNRGPEPFSLALACASLQDKYDVLNFYRDNLIATSGTVGDWIDESLIPTNLGVNWPERIQKWISYKKAGIALIDTAQDGRAASGQAPMNTLFSGYDDTIKVQAIQAIQLAIDSVEQTCSSITGVFRERLNGIEQRDAVSNIKVGQNNSFIITKQWFHQMDLVLAELLTDVLNTAKVVYKEGLTGELILGDKLQKEFTALPEHFTITDFDVHVISSADASKDLETIKQFLPDFIRGGALPPDLAFEAITTKSPTDIRWKIRKAFKKQKEENNQIMQLQQQLQQAQQQMQQMQNELSKAQAKVESLDEQRLKIEEQKMQLDNQVAMYKARTERDYREAEVKIDQDKVKIEQAQLYDNNPRNDKIRMS